VSAETKIAFTDFKSSMSIHDRKTFRNKRWIPEFALNDQELRHVLAQKAWQFVHGGKEETVPDLLIGNMKELEFMVAEKQKRLQEFGKPGDTANWNFIVHEDIVKRFGYVGLHAAIAYRSWRLGQLSTQIAEDLRITPYNVRIILYRLCEIARKLGYATTFQRNKSTKSAEEKQRTQRLRDRRKRLKRTITPHRNIEAQVR